jgi:hypothetical protein
MTLRNTGSIAAMVVNSIDNIPSSVNSGTNIQDWIELGALRVGNYTGTTPTITNVEDKFQPILFDIGRMFTLAKMVGVGADFNFSLGEFAVNKGASSSSDSSQLDLVVQNVNMELKNLGKNIPYNVVGV